MADLFVETKLLLPRPRPQILSRPRLGDLMLNGSRCRLTLVAAPAGFGKTTLLTSWLSVGPHAHDEDQVVAWVSLDEADRDPASFWAYVLLALERAVPGRGPRPSPCTRPGRRRSSPC